MTTLPMHREFAETVDGPEQNERLTYRAAVPLTLLLAAEGVTLLFMHQLLRVHMFIGILLIPPVLLKLGSTGYRFARYYLGSPAYRSKGPPQLVLRLLAPFLVLATVAMLGSGVWLMLLGQRSGAVLELHKVCFIVWAVAFGVHFLVYAPRVLRSLAREMRHHVLGASKLLNVAVVSALALGLAIALVFLPDIRSWISGGY
jgi:hypothetical protein